jgi:hypothetical protein
LIVGLAEIPFLVGANDVAGGGRYEEGWSEDQPSYVVLSG